jgi:hypothetical protein
MLYMLINRTRPDLSAEQYAELGRLAQGFYDDIPQGIEVLGDWAAADGSRTFTLIQTEDAKLLERVQEPFRPYVDIETVMLTPVTGWRGPR